jgi:hypothetical protein
MEAFSTGFRAGRGDMDQNVHLAVLPPELVGAMNRIGRTADFEVLPPGAS